MTLYRLLCYTSVQNKIIINFIMQNSLCTNNDSAVIRKQDFLNEINSANLKNLNLDLIQLARNLAEKWDSYYSNRSIRFIHINYIEPTSAQKALIKSAVESVPELLKTKRELLSRTIIDSQIPQNYEQGSTPIRIILSHVFYELDYIASCLEKLATLSANAMSTSSLLNLTVEQREITIAQEAIRRNIDILCLRAKMDQNTDLLNATSVFLQQLGKDKAFTNSLSSCFLQCLGDKIDTLLKE